MKKQDHVILREVFNRLANRNSLKDAEIAAIYQLLIFYASNEQGSMHLKDIRILDELAKSDCLVKLQD